MLFDAKISAAYSALTYSQRKVANYVQEKYEDVAFETLEKLAAKAGVSTTTVIRFSRALGYSGYSEMQEDIKKEIQTKGSLPDRLERAAAVYPEEIVSADVGDVCIAYIFPRYSKTGINILAWMRSRGVKIVLITSNNNLPVRSYGDICFRCAIQSVSCKNSLTAPMCLTNYLVAELALRNYDEAHEVLSRTEEILSTGFYLGI